MTKKIQKTDNIEKENKSKKETSKHMKLSSTFLEVAHVCKLEVRDLFKELEVFYQENKHIFDINKISKLTDSVYKFQPVSMIPVLESSLSFCDTLSKDLDNIQLSPNRFFSFLLVFKVENNEQFLFKVKDLDFKKQYTKDSLTSVFQEYNKNIHELHKENLELKNQIESLFSHIMKEREEAQQIRQEEKEARKKDREMLKKVLAVMQNLNNSNVIEREKFQAKFEPRFQQMEEKMQIHLDTLSVISENLKYLLSEE